MKPYDDVSRSCDALLELIKEKYKYIDLTIRWLAIVKFNYSYSG